MNKKVLETMRLRHIRIKKEELERTREEVLKRNPQNSFEYFSTLNSVFNENRIESRKRII